MMAMSWNISTATNENIYLKDFLTYYLPLPEAGLKDLDYIMVDTKQTKMLLLMKMLLYITTEGCVLESNRLRPPHLSSYIFQHLIVFETDKCSDLIVDSVFCIILKLTIDSFDSLMSNCCEPFTRFWRTTRCLGNA